MEQTRICLQHRRYKHRSYGQVNCNLCFSFLTTVRAGTTAERAEFPALASRSALGLVAPSTAHTPDLLASFPGVMASQALAFPSTAKSFPLSRATVVCLAGSTPQYAVVAPMPP